MKSDALFFLGVLAFFFILWVAAGGPSRPISFAGPYITPITDVDTTQYGYGDGSVEYHVGGASGGSTESIWSQIMNIESGIFQLQRDRSELRAYGEASALEGSITVSGGGTSSEDPDQEFVTLRNAGSAPVDITGWRLQSAASGESARIPEGAWLPRSGRVNSTDRIVLEPGEEAIVITGDSPIGVSFKENMCTGYLESRQEFYPSLSRQCPAAYDIFDRFYGDNELRDDECYYRMQATPVCTTPDDDGVSSRCRALIDDYLDYSGCVDHHRTETGFAGRTWRIYLEERDELWKSSRDGVKLLDASGRTVDLYSY